MNIQTVAVRVDQQEMIKDGYNMAAKMIEQKQMLSVIPYMLPSAQAVGYCQGIIDYCRGQEASGVRLYRSE